MQVAGRISIILGSPSPLKRVDARRAEHESIMQIAASCSLHYSEGRSLRDNSGPDDEVVQTLTVGVPVREGPGRIARGSFNIDTTLLEKVSSDNAF
jgi:hypothetical protein